MTVHTHGGDKPAVRFSSSTREDVEAQASLTGEQRPQVAPLSPLPHAGPPEHQGRGPCKGRCRVPVTSRTPCLPPEVSPAQVGLAQPLKDSPPILHPEPHWEQYRAGEGTCFPPCPTQTVSAWLGKVGAPLSLPRRGGSGTRNRGLPESQEEGGRESGKCLLEEAIPTAHPETAWISGASVGFLHCPHTAPWGAQRGREHASLLPVTKHSQLQPSQPPCSALPTRRDTTDRRQHLRSSKQKKFLLKNSSHF